MWLVVGLGNPGEKYENNRHNIGFMVLDALGKDCVWETDAKKRLHMTEKTFGKTKATLIKPQTFMNKSGSAVRKFVTSKKKAEKLVVVHDDVDLPFGTIKVSFGRGSGGHRGVDSIIKTLGTKHFVRVRVGVVPTTPTGKLKKPSGEQKVLDHLMGNFKSKEAKTLKGVIKDAVKAVETIVTEGKDAAMNTCN